MTISLEPEAFIKAAQLLVVGAGGIGCELLKNLVLVGFENIHILDLDTIDTTNLNRQFLFRRKHVGMGKAEVAKSAVLEFRPNARITAIKDDIKNSANDSEFIRRYDLVLNALDNNDARQFVNRMCFVADVPLIDSGSTGYNGQVTPIIKGVSACFECRPLPRQKSFPVCTIRSTPQKPEHCVAWAKYLFELLFGPKDESNLLSDFRHGLGQPCTRPEETEQIGKKVFQFFFDEEIQKQIELRTDTTFSSVPKPLQLDRLLSNAADRPDDVRAIWDDQASASVFLSCIQTMFQERSESIGTATFTKDDALAVDFVTAAANLRMTNHNIPRMSRWDIESIAGSIIPAVASTNAIVAGLQTTQAINLLRAKAAGTGELPVFTDVKQVWVKQHAQGPYQLLPEALDISEPTCFICQTPELKLKIHSLKAWTLRALVQQIFIGELGCLDAVVELGETRLCIYSPEMLEDDPDMTDNVKLSLYRWGVRNLSTLYVVDCSQTNFNCNLVVEEDPTLGEGRHPDDDPFKFFKLERKSGSGEQLLPTPARQTENGLKRAREETVDDDIDGKYKELKKRKMLDENDDDVIEECDENKLSENVDAAKNEYPTKMLTGTSDANPSEAVLDLD